jgi:transposase InsO family protein
MTWLPWRRLSTADRARHSDGGHLPRLSTRRYSQFRVMLRRPVETKQYPSLASGCDAGKQASAHPPAQSAMPMTTRWPKRPSLPSSASCSTGAAFRSQAEARMAVYQFIEGFYNPTRRHSALGYLSPIEYEARTTAVND